MNKQRLYNHLSGEVKELNTENIGRVRKKLFILIFVELIIMIFAMPCLEYPDSQAHFWKIYNNKNHELYFYILALFRPIVEAFTTQTVTFQSNEAFGYFFWQPYYIHNVYNYLSVMLYQLINVMMVALSILIFKKVIDNDKRLCSSEKNFLKNIILLYYLYPATAYLVVGITPDFIIYIFQPFLFYFLYKQNYIISIISSVALCIVADKSGIICLALSLLCMMMSFVWKIKSKHRGLGLFLIIFIICVMGCAMIRINVDMIESDNLVIQIMKLTLSRNGNLPTKYLTFFLTSFCFWGSGSYITFIPLYVVYGLLLLRLIKNIVDKSVNKKLQTMFIVALGLIFGLIIIFPSYCHIRYYMFFIILLLWCTFSIVFKDNYLLNSNMIKMVGIILFVHNIVLALSIGLYTFFIL